MSITLLVRMGRLSVIYRTVRRQTIYHGIFGLEDSVCVPCYYVVKRNRRRFRAGEISRFPPLNTVSIVGSISIGSEYIVYRCFIYFSRFLRSSYGGVLLYVVFKDMCFFFFSFRNLAMKSISRARDRFVRMMNTRRLDRYHVRQDVCAFYLFARLLCVTRVIVMTGASTNPFMVLVYALSINLGCFFNDVRSIDPSFGDVRTSLNGRRFKINLNNVIQVGIRLFRVSAKGTRPRECSRWCCLFRFVVSC